MVNVKTESLPYSAILVELGVFVGDIDVLVLASPEVDGEVDELRVLLDELLQGVLLEVAGRLVLQVEAGTTRSISLSIKLKKKNTYVIWVPRPRVLPRGSLKMAKLASAVDSHTCWSSLMFLETTVTLSATRKAE